MRILGLACALVGALALPASAVGADFYVDKQNVAGTMCTLADPCPTVQAGINAAGTNDTIRVDDSPTAYAEQLTLDSGKSLIADNFTGGAEGSTIIDGGATSAISIIPSAAGTIQGFILRGDSAPVLAVENVVITGNTFDDPQESGSGDVNLSNSSITAATVVSGNTFTDSATGTLDNGVSINSGADPVILNNTFSGYDFAIQPANDGSDPTIQGNVISGGEGDHMLAASIFPNDDAQPAVIGNTIQAPATGTRGIYVLENTTTAAQPTGATLRRNRVLGFPSGVVAEDTTGPVTLDSDLIANSTAIGLQLLDNTPGADTQGNVTAVNVTLASNAFDISALDGDLTLDSSIVEDPILTNGTVNCTITFSRGPTLGAPNCGNFQTTAPPGFVGGGDFHLATGSAMVDAGNPADPDPASLDIDGGAREVLNLGSCASATARRDIGADEANFIITPGCAGPPASTLAPPPATPKKKRKCKKKRRKGTAAAKRCKKKRK